MITGIFLGILLVFIDGIVFLLSTFGPIDDTSAVFNGINQIGSYLSPLNNIIPIDTIIQILIFEIVFETALLTYKFIKWGYQKIPGIS